MSSASVVGTSTRQDAAAAAHHRVEYYTWVDRHGNPVPPPSTTPGDITSSAVGEEDHYEHSGGAGNERLINLDISPGQNLGLMIRGGVRKAIGLQFIPVMMIIVVIVLSWKQMFLFWSSLFDSPSTVWVST